MAWFGRRGGAPRVGARLRAIHLDGDRAAELDFGATRVSLEAGVGVVLAVPPARAVELLPGLVAPQASRAIVNAHFRVEGPLSLPGDSPLLGVIGGTAQWIFVRGDVVSVTVSAADALLDEPADHLAALLWADTAKALGLAGEPLPPYRIVKERRATFAQPPAEVARRPGPRTHYGTLILAGDRSAPARPATLAGPRLPGRPAARPSP